MTVFTVTIKADDVERPAMMTWDTRNSWGSFSALVTGVAQGLAGEGGDEPLKLETFGGSHDGAALELE
jgi:hypothetical protein